MCRDLTASLPGTRLNLKLLAERLAPLALLTAAVASGTQPCKVPARPGTRLALYTSLMRTTACAAQLCQPNAKRQ